MTPPNIKFRNNRKNSSNRNKSIGPQNPNILRFMGPINPNRHKQKNDDYETTRPVEKARGEGTTKPRLFWNSFINENEYTFITNCSPLKMNILFLKCFQDIKIVEAPSLFTFDWIRLGLMCPYFALNWPLTIRLRPKSTHSRQVRKIYLSIQCYLAVCQFLWWEGFMWDTEDNGKGFYRPLKSFGWYVDIRV